VPNSRLPWSEGAAKICVHTGVESRYGDSHGTTTAAATIKASNSAAYRVLGARAGAVTLTHALEFAALILDLMRGSSHA
jgi:hypothetical protein